MIGPVLVLVVDLRETPLCEKSPYAYILREVSMPKNPSSAMSINVRIYIGWLNIGWLRLCVNLDQNHRENDDNEDGEVNDCVFD
jgi:hypothetical protein